ncbi:tyrosine-type recombinase/integrase [Paracoccus ravus]|uniref:tyrosine-type recombinase/integrase n=1 Tax=Paracoccus ravus TaxID=2447760 RepID=UPI00106E92FF|nr:site-specific integrase [Paracoccus ravus]
MVDNSTAPQKPKRGGLRSSEIPRLKDGRHSDGNGLIFVVRGGSRLFVYRHTDPLTGKRREVSLGSYPDLTLTEARLKRDAAKLQVKSGKRASPRIERADAERSLSIWASRAHEANARRLRRGGPTWLRCLENHILPQLGDADITKVTARDIVATIRPIWTEKPSSSTEVVSRLRAVWRYAAAEFPNLDLTVIDRAVIQLGHQGHKVTNYEALPHADIPAAYQKLGDDSLGALAARLLILTASRSRPIRMARIADFDLEDRVWTVPGPDMKSGRPFRVPLSDEAIHVIGLAKILTRSNTLLFAARHEQNIESSTIWTIIRRNGIKSTAHGFRSSFRSWCADSAIDFATAEAALDHVVGNATSRAYQRSDLLDLRRPVMADWAKYVTTAHV